MRQHLNRISVLLFYNGSTVKLTVAHAIEFSCTLLTSLTVFRVSRGEDLLVIV